MKKEVIVIGGGAAGFFTAITCAENNRNLKVTVLEKSSKLLSKVKISGGGRCNVAHACFDPKLLVKHYPRGEKQLLGPFTRFSPLDTVSWFEKRGVRLKKEEDGRMFPLSDSSQTIIDCFLAEAKKIGISIMLNTGVDELFPPAENQMWKLITSQNKVLEADVIVVASGSSYKIWNALQNLGHTVIPPVPSLFTFNINDERIKGLEGLSVETAIVSTASNRKLSATGPLLITHWGLSGPSVLRLSAWGARYLAEKNHQFEIEINWTGLNSDTIIESFGAFKKNNPRKGIIANPMFGLPRRLWEKLVMWSNIRTTLNFADLSNKQISQLTCVITASRFSVTSKSTFKDEFVTAGGVDLREVDFKTMQSRKFKGLFFVGEVLDIDAITGGFNFQAAWTTGWIAGSNI